MMIIVAVTYSKKKEQAKNEQEKKATAKTIMEAQFEQMVQVFKQKDLATSLFLLMLFFYKVKIAQMQIAFELSPFSIRRNHSILEKTCRHSTDTTKS